MVSSTTQSAWTPGVAGSTSRTPGTHLGKTKKMAKGVGDPNERVVRTVVAERRHEPVRAGGFGEAGETGDRRGEIGGAVARHRRDDRGDHDGVGRVLLEAPHEGRRVRHGVRGGVVCAGEDDDEQGSVRPQEPLPARRRVLEHAAQGRERLGGRRARDAEVAQTGKYAVERASEVGALPARVDRRDRRRRCQAAGAGAGRGRSVAG